MAKLAFLLAPLLLAASFVNAQGSAWSQCGGIGWSGATTCVSGYTCTYSNAYYSQCLPGSAATTVATTSTTAPVTSAPATSSTPVSSSSSGAATTTTPSSPPASCATPSTVSGFSATALPDPFLHWDGTRVTTAADWECRRAQLAAVILGYEGGALPAKPSSVTGSWSGSGTTGTLVVNAANGGASVSFSNSITYPSGTMPTGGWPLLIALGGGSIPVPAGVATLNYNNDNIGQQTDTSSRGKGLFFNLYGSSATASAMTAWAWGVSRIIDVLEITPTAKINLSKIAVTGCSRNGKGALWIGAFEPRIALTIPQESGSGGDAAWRLSKFEKDSGSAVQDATEIVTEDVWFSANFNNYVNNLNTLPYDHHSLIALIAPRGVISYANTDYLWLSGLSSWGSVSAAHTVFTALGVPDNHGFEQIGGHSHCAWPSSLTDSLNAFFNKFLLNQPSANTKYFATNNQFNGKTFDPARWITWTTPTLT